MGDETTSVETWAERIKRTWNEGDPQRAARRAERKAARRAAKPEAAGLVRRTGHHMADLGWHLLVLLVVLAVIVLPAVVVWAFVDSDAAAAVGGVMIGIVVCAAVVLMSAGTKYSGDW